MKKIFEWFIMSESRFVRCLGALLVITITLFACLFWALLVEVVAEHQDGLMLTSWPEFLSYWLGGIVIASMFLVAAFRG